MENGLKTKVAIILSCVLVIVLLIPSGILFCQNRELREQLTSYSGQLDIQTKKLTDSLQRAETKIAANTNEIELFAESAKIDLTPIREDLNTLGARLEAIATTKAKTSTVIKNYYSSSKSEPSSEGVIICEESGRPIDIHGYTKTTENTKLSNSNGMEIADISFSAARKNPWSSKVYGINYTINNTIGEGPEGQTILHTELLVESEAQPNETFRIEGVESRVLQAPSQPAGFDWWNPTLYLMAQPGMVVYSELDFSISLSVGFTVFSYNDDWRFLGVSLGYDGYQNAFRASFIPVLYNIGSPLPLFDDLYIGLDVGVSHEVDVSVGLIIGTSL